MTPMPPSPFLISIPQPAGLPVGETSIASACVTMSPEQRAPVIPDAESFVCGQSPGAICHPISVIGHNPITHAVEVRPQVSPGVLLGSLPSGESDPSVMLDCAPGESTDCIGEIFHHARKLIAEDNRRAEDFINWQDFEAALEPLPLFIRDGKYLKRSAA